MEDLKGLQLPPHVISMNEGDPPRDGGKEHFRKLNQAGVSVSGRVVLGTVHVSTINFWLTQCLRSRVSVI